MRQVLGSAELSLHRVMRLAVTMMKMRQMSVGFSSSSSEIECWIQPARLILGRSFTISADLPAHVDNNPPSDSLIIFYVFTVGRTIGWPLALLGSPNEPVEL